MNDETHAQIVKDWADGYSLTVIADMHAISITEVRFALDVHCQMHGKATK